jgi:hypothetical protein
MTVLGRQQQHEKQQRITERKTFTKPKIILAILSVAGVAAASGPEAKPKRHLRANQRGKIGTDPEQPSSDPNSYARFVYGCTAEVQPNDENSYDWSQIDSGSPAPVNTARNFPSQ